MANNRLALVIGVSDYEYANSLKNPVNDADSMELILKKLGFDVIKLKDVSYRDFKLSLNEFGEKLNEYETGLFYFAGHGIQVKGFNYLIPSDANPKSENQVEFDCVNANLVMSLMEDAKNEVNIIFLDACRNNPFERSWSRSPTTPGLSYISAPFGTLIAYSTAPNSTASDGNGENGLYTSVLIKELLSPNQTVLQSLQKVRMSVIKTTDGEQVPWESTSLIDDFIFNDDKYFSLGVFCKSAIYSKTDVVFNHLNLKIWDVHRIVYSGLELNEIDRNAGVIEVYYKNGISYFDVFEEIEVKIMKNGERIYHLFTTTKDYDKVTQISKELYSFLGLGLYDDERHSSFRELEKIKLIALNKTNDVKNELITVWTFNRVSFSLKYLLKPRKQLFMFSITVKPEKAVVTETIEELLHNKFHLLLPSAKNVTIEKKEKGYFKNYEVELPILEFDFFDKAIIRLFFHDNDEVESVNIFLKNETENPTVNFINRLVSDLTNIYGEDTYGNGYLTGEEADQILNGRHWTGRMWDMNIQHQIWDMDSQGEEMLYGVHIDYDYIDEVEFQVSIIGYSSLMTFLEKKNKKSPNKGYDDHAPSSHGA